MRSKRIIVGWIGSGLACASIVGSSASGQVSPQFALAEEHVVVGARANGYVLLADVDGDGLLDAVSNELVDALIRVQLQQSGGTWSAPIVTTFTSPFLDTEPPFAVGDVNEDGLADIVVSTHVSNLPGPGAPNIAVRFGSPSGQFVNQLNLNNQPGAPFPAHTDMRGIALYDIDRDGHLDILSKTSGTSPNFVQGISVMRGDGTGAFGPSIESGQGAYDFLLVGDVDGDSNLDVVTVNNTGSDSHASSAAYVNLGDGAGHFVLVGTEVFDCRLSTPSGNPRAFLEDVDGDGRADIVMFGNRGSQTGAGGIYVRKSIGGGAFTQTLHIVSSSLSTILLQDVNGDARPDILRFDRLTSGAVNQVLVNDGAGGFATSAPFPGIPSFFEPRDAAAGQLFGSALPDVLVMGVSDGLGQMRFSTFENTTPGSSVTAFCFGTASACSCSNGGGIGHGCANSVDAAGARLVGSGVASVAADSFVLAASGMSDSAALYFQGTSQQSGGSGTTFGDGLRCASGSITRLATVQNAGGVSQYPTAGAPSVSVKGQVVAPGTRTYQVWYRNAAAFCTPSTFNLTNGLQVDWIP
jgi:hypothetical protein